jgi:hypothetical protein
MREPDASLARRGTRLPLGGFQGKPWHAGEAGCCGPGEYQESDMTSEMQIHTIARQMLERHGPGAIAEAARNALSCERKGETEEAREWRHVESAMKIMRGPSQS